MAKTLEQVAIENLGGLTMMLCQKEVEISRLQERVAELEAQLPKDPKKKEDK